jgi:hypothetical protein
MEATSKKKKKYTKKEPTKMDESKPATVPPPAPKIEG